MQRRIFSILVMLCVALPAALTPLTGSAQQRIGVLMLHGKSPGSNQDPNLTPLKDAFEREAWLVSLPDMPWSRGRYLEGNWNKAMAEMAEHVKALRDRGATTIIIVGHSMGVPAALSHAASGCDAQALVLLAPGHAPKAYYSVPALKAVRESVDEARALVAAGKGDSRERFHDINQGRQQVVIITAKDYLSYFDPGSDAEMSVTAPRVPVGTPVLTVVGDEDWMFTRARAYFADQLPVNPKSQYLEVKANHLSTPRVAGNDIVRWIKAAVGE